METIFPHDKNIQVSKLSIVFRNTTASYKYYWFISLIQLLSQKNNSRILIKEVLIKMICNAWYPINYFKLNFGYSDKLSQNISQIRKILNIPVEIAPNELFDLLSNSQNREINKLIWHFEQLVPYRFLSPWIKGTKSRVINLSQSYTNDCLYKICETDYKYVEINPNWNSYLIYNKKIILDFSYWNLLKYLQLRNPNVPNIAEKLIKPIERGSLTKQRNFWKIIFNNVISVKCIYTGRLLTINSFDIEHFIPWSFVSHNQLWNLIPADSSINSSKGNKLPSLEKYFDGFAEQQYKALNIVYSMQSNNKLLEDFLILDSNIDTLVNRPLNEFKKRYYDVIAPLIQIANNSGFEFWYN
jgi:HNH endonuclease